MFSNLMKLLLLDNELNNNQIEREIIFDKYYYKKISLNQLWEFNNYRNKLKNNWYIIYRYYL